MRAIVLTGGKGTRLLPLTEKVKKAYLPLGSKRVIDHVLDRIPTNIFDIIISADDSGALSALANALTGGIPIMVVCGDNYFTENLTAFYRMYMWERALTFYPYLSMIAVYDVGDPTLAKNYGVVSVFPDGTVRSFEEKPEKPTSTLVSTGIYMFPPALFPRIRALAKSNPEGNLGLVIKDFYPRRTVQTYTMGGFWIDMGTHETYKLAQEYVEGLKK